MLARVRGDALFRAGIAAAILIAPGAAAATGAKTSSLSWVRLPGAERCVATQPLARAVEERLGRSVFVSASAAEVSVEARAEPVAKGFRATVFLRDARGELGKREISSEGPSCDGLTEPLAIVIAVMIDPDAVLGPKPAPPSPVPPAEPSERVIVRVETERVLVPVEAPSPPHLRADLGAGGRLAFGVVPGTGIGVSASALFVPARFVGIEVHASWLAPSGVDTALGGAVDFSHANVGLGICPIVVGEGRFLFWSCGLGELGGLFARPTGLDRTVNEVRATFALGLGARASFQIAGPFALRAGISSAVPLLRPPFEVTDADGGAHEVFRQSPVTASADFGVGASFH